MKNRIFAAGLIGMGLLASPSAFAKPDKHNSLPPGLAKKAQNGQPLPPGWQKKLHKGDVLQKEIYDEGRVIAPVNSKGIITVEVDGTLLKLYDKTRRIVEIIEH